MINLMFDSKYKISDKEIENKSIHRLRKLKEVYRLFLHDCHIDYGSGSYDSNEFKYCFYKHELIKFLLGEDVRKPDKSFIEDYE